MRTENHTYLEYEIQITEHPPWWEAAIYATKPDMPHVDWENMPIRGANPQVVLIDAKRRICDVVRIFHPELPETDDADQEQSESA